MRERHKAIPAVFLIIERGRGGKVQVLLMRRQNTGYMDGMLGLPSGHVEEGESPEQAMIREAREEIGILIPMGELRLVHTQYNRSSHKGNDYVNFYFTAESWRGRARVAEPNQCSELMWVDYIGREEDLPEDIISYVRTALYLFEDGEHHYTEVEV